MNHLTVSKTYTPFISIENLADTKPRIVKIPSTRLDALYKSQTHKDLVDNCVSALLSCSNFDEFWSLYRNPQLKMFEILPYCSNVMDVYWEEYKYTLSTGNRDFNFYFHLNSNKRKINSINLCI